MEATPLLSAGTYQTLGTRTFWLFLSKWLEVPVGFLFLAFIASFIRRSSFVPLEYQRYVAMASIVLLVISIVCILISSLAARFVYNRMGFCLSDDALKIRKGVFTKTEMAIPYRQIQNVSLEQSFVYQIFGVSKLVIVTAGHDDGLTPQDESKGIMPTIDTSLAGPLQEELLRRSDVQRIVGLKQQ
jgi:uncharacterized membrane protein YdbT with pleckstrin-like domain